MRPKIYEEMNEIDEEHKNNNHNNQAIFLWYFHQLSCQNCAPALLAIIHDIQTHNFGK